MILTVVSHSSAVIIMFAIGIAATVLPIIFFKVSGSESEKLRTAKNWAVFIGVLMCMPMVYYLYANIRYDLWDMSENDKLYLAAENKNLKAAKKFVEQGAVPDGENRYGKTAFYRAVEKDDADMAEFLLKSGADPNYCGDEPITPLCVAAGNMSEDMVYVLLQYGAEPDYKPGYYVPALHYAGSKDKGYNAAIVKLLVDAGADPASEAISDGKVMLPFRYYYNEHKNDKDITPEEEERYESIKEMLYKPYIEWLRVKFEGVDGVTEDYEAVS